MLNEWLRSVGGVWLGLCALGAQGCSEPFRACETSPGCASLPAEVQGDAGANAGHAATSDDLGPSLVACLADANCDDGLRCNGVESCLGGSCQPGVPVACDNAASCVEGASTTRCAYPDPSPWLVYEADEDKPGFDQLYAVKEGLIGVQTPLRISGELPLFADEILEPGSYAWSSDGTWLSFDTKQGAEAKVTHSYVVHFASGLPEAPIELTKGIAPGHTETRLSPSGDYALLLAGPRAYALKLTADGSSLPLLINADGHAVTSALWVLGGAGVLYTTACDAYLVAFDERGPATPLPLANPTSAKGLHGLHTSADGHWISVLDGAEGELFAKASPGAPIQPIARASFGGLVAFSFSPDARYLAYAASERQAGRSEVYLIDLEQEALPRITLQEGQHLGAESALGPWSPDSSFLVLYGDGPAASGAERRLVRTFRAQTREMQSTPYVVSLQDQALGFIPKSPTFLLSYQQSESAPAELLAVDPAGVSATLDQNEEGVPYRYAEFAPNGSAALVCTGTTEEDTDMFFLDLRRGPGDSQPTRLPGQGTAAMCAGDFASDARGLAYYRVSADGARVLYWVDTTQRELATPQRVSSAGKVRDFAWQPLPSGAL